MLTTLLIIATLTLGYATIKSIAYEIHKGHAHVDTTPQTVRIIPARTIRRV